MEWFHRKHALWYTYRDLGYLRFRNAPLQKKKSKRGVQKNCRLLSRHCKSTQPKSWGRLATVFCNSTVLIWSFDTGFRNQRLLLLIWWPNSRHFADIVTATSTLEPVDHHIHHSTLGRIAISGWKVGPTEILNCILGLRNFHWDVCGSESDWVTGSGEW